ncbi:MAG: DUF3343 domain-containing protein [Lachnospiraceae bacterium]|nr:DUF3343 domain-containing protein [Lachnospiraceae bacterium]
MREKRLCIVITFHTTAEAMATEKVCRERELDGRLITVPRVLTADCGIAWCGPVSTRYGVESALNEKKIEFEEIHELEM